MKKDLGGGECVAAGAMPAGYGNREVAGDGIEPVIDQFRKNASRQLHRAQMLVNHAVTGIDARDFVIEKVGVEV